MIKFTEKDIGCIIDGNLHDRDQILDILKSWGYEPDEYTQEEKNDIEY